ncbi:MAG: AAA family ATPase, partial [Thermomicrobiales bacterium]
MMAPDHPHETTVLRGKLRWPRLGEGLAPRPRLTARLDHRPQTPLTLVSAPAGFGKTTLLAEWATSHAASTAWLRADERDRNLTRFVTHVVAAIQTVVPSAATSPLDIFQRSPSLPAAEIGAILADALLALPRNVVLIIDDYQQAASGDVETFLDGFLPNVPPSFHLLLSTRNDPALPLPRMRLHGMLTELRAADLRFTDEETRALLRISARAADDPSLVEILQEQTEGWIAGLRLAIHILPAGEDPARIADVTAGERHLLDFLMDEVLAKQPPDIQAFLQETAIVDRAPPGGSQRLLSQLAQADLFVERTGGEDEWFRFHPLFRHLLQRQLALRLDPSQLADRHMRASAWFAERGLIADAIHHCLAADNMAGAATVVEGQVHAALAREEWTALAGWLALLPEAIIDASPALLLAKAWVSQLSGRVAPLQVILRKVEALLAGADADAAPILALQGERDALSLISMLPMQQDPAMALVRVRRALEQIPASHRFAHGFATLLLGIALQSAGQAEEAVRSLTGAAERDEEQIDAGSIRALFGLIFVHRQSGNLHAFGEVARHMLVLAQRHRLPVATGWAHWALGWLAYEQDELETAIAHFSAVVAEYPGVHLTCECRALFGLALAYQARSLPVDADRALQRLREIVLESRNLEYLPTVHA